MITRNYRLAQHDTRTTARPVTRNTWNAAADTAGARYNLIYSFYNTDVDNVGGRVVGGDAKGC